MKSPLPANFAGSMLTDEEIKFIEYWGKNRERKKRSFRQLALGLPLGTAIVILVFANYFAGWYKRADMVARTDPSQLLVLLIAGICIVIFISIFSIHHTWDRNEQRYRELMEREKGNRQ